MDIFSTLDVKKYTSSGTNLFVESILKGELARIRTTWRVIPRCGRSVREFESELIEATFNEFYQWLSSPGSLYHGHPFSTIPSIDSGTVSLYADYKYFHEVFDEVIDDDGQIHPANPLLICRGSCLYIPESSPCEFKTIFDWAELGIPEVTAASSTLWMGSFGAHTPLHYDSYGHNVIIQLHGSKKWCIWYPTEVNCEVLRPTRIPYEESSVYADCSCFDPMQASDMSRHPPDFIATLQPGDVLYMPKHCWHFVVTVSVHADHY